MSYNDVRRRDLAGQLKSARQNAGLTAADAAKLISAFGIRCTTGTLLAWERGSGEGTREPFASDLSVIAKIYRCPVDAFYSTSPVNAVSQPA